MASDPTSRSLAGNDTARSPASRRYGEIRARVGRLVPSNYDISDTCNLRCEGCLFFDGADRHGHDDAADDAAWDRFFAEEAARGVNFAYIAGAEPALVPNRLRSAHRHIANGVIFTNGTRRIPPEIDFRIHVSVWGAPAENARLRGADNVTKAIRHYAGDPRATFIYTIGRTNIADIFETARVMHAAGCTLSFNYFSPTTSYLGKLAAQSGADDYFKISSADENLVLTRDDFAAARREIEHARAAFGETILYSLDYDTWVTGEAPHGVDPETGIATHCGNRLTAKHVHYSVDLRRSSGKCCSPNIDCRECRAYAPGYGTYLSRYPAIRHDPAELDRWLGVWDLWTRLFLRHVGEAAQAAA